MFRERDRSFRRTMKESHGDHRRPGKAIQVACKQHLTARARMTEIDRQIAVEIDNYFAK